MSLHTRIRLLACLVTTTVLVSMLATPASATPDVSPDPSGESMPGAIPGWTQTFADDFTSPSTLSNYQVYGGTPTDGSNACWAPSHVAVTGGEMVLKAYKDPAAIAANGCTGDANQMVTGGVKLTSNSQTYGKYEIRMRVDNGQGVSLVTLLWPTGDTWPPEIDFTEDNGAAPRSVDTATEHWGTATNFFQISDTLAVDLTQWHTVGVEWSPGKIVYTMDGLPWATETNANVSDVPMQLAFQTQAWQCGVSSWEQCADTSTPAEVDMDVDWIAVYAPGGQPGVDDLAVLPAVTPETPSVPLLALAAATVMAGGWLAISRRRRRRASETAR
jgi:beta-glucanase (GH16 family)